MKIAIGADHGGFDLKETLKDIIKGLGHEIKDIGCYSKEPVNYPEIGRMVVGLVASGMAERGILICGTGIGMSIMANRTRGIRAALCHEIYTARMSREHNDANILCMGGRVVGPAIAEEMVKCWLSTQFAGGRHACRLAMIDHK
ncbi:MAG: ribose 5-phosphate isomerase B [Dissulfurimicrobium sp.]